MHDEGIELGNQTEEASASEYLTFESAIELIVDRWLEEEYRDWIENDPTIRDFFKNAIKSAVESTQDFNEKSDFNDFLEKERKFLNEFHDPIEIQKPISVVEFERYSYRPLCNAFIKDARIIFDVDKKSVGKANSFRAVRIFEQIWEGFRLHEMHLRMLYRHDGEGDAPGWMKLLKSMSIFYTIDYHSLCLLGNKNGALYANSQFDWTALDAFIARSEGLCKHSRLISFYFAHWRIGSETWKYNFDCCNSLTHKSGYVSISSDVDRAKKVHYSYNQAQTDLVLSKAKRWWFGIGLFFFAGASMVGAGYYLNRPEILILE